MPEARPEFSHPKKNRKGYSATEVDEFVGRVLYRINHDRSHDGMAASEIGIMFFGEERGESAYDPQEVDDWMVAMREKVAEVESHLREEDIPQSREGSVVDMPAPPHFADRFPRVSRAVLGFSVDEVDRAIDQLRESFKSGQLVPTSAQILGLTFTEEAGGYRQVAVAETMELIALARDAR